MRCAEGEDDPPNRQAGPRRLKSHLPLTARVREEKRMQTMTRLPHEGHVPTLPGRTNTGEKYISVSVNGGYRSRGEPQYHVTPGTHSHYRGEEKDSSLARWFPLTPSGFAAAIAYRDAVLAGLPISDRIAGSMRRGLLTGEQLDALRTKPARPRYTRAEPDITWEKCEEIVGDDLRFRYPESLGYFVFPAKDVQGFGSDYGVAFPGDERFLFVEVKKAHTTLSKNEYLRAVEQGADFVLALVDKSGEIEYVFNPANTGTFETVVTTTYRWKRS